MIATSSFLTALECTKFVFSRGSAPDPTGGAYSTSSDSLAGLRGTNFRGGWGGEERPQPFCKFLDLPLTRVIPQVLHTSSTAAARENLHSTCCKQSALTTRPDKTKHGNLMMSHTSSEALPKVPHR